LSDIGSLQTLEWKRNNNKRKTKTNKTEKKKEMEGEDFDKGLISELVDFKDIFFF